MKTATTIKDVLDNANHFGIAVTEDQAVEIAWQANYYDHPEVAAHGVHQFNFVPAHESYTYEEPDAQPVGVVEVAFMYYPEDDPADWVAGGCGLEVTRFNQDGTVRDSQDFG